MDALQYLRLLADPTLILAAQGMTPDPWQRAFLNCSRRSIMLCCCRGAGKTRAAAAKALHHALFREPALVLLVSRAQRQASELFRYCREGFRALGRPVRVAAESRTTLEFANGNRIISLPGREETIRSFQGVTLLVKDEAARIPDDLHRSVTPMLAIRNGQEINLSTPWGQRGWFWRKWTEDPDVERFRVTWKECPRHSEAFIARELREHGASWVAQEYECSFASMAGIVYPDFAQRCAIGDAPAPVGRKVGGIDFGYRDPFVALWGCHDSATDMLIVHGEHYRRECGLREHAALMPKGYVWEADPSQPALIDELRRANFTVHKAFNKIEPGIAAVRARIERGKLKVVRSACPHLLEEAALYCYDDEGSETPIDENNHALDALRYMIARIDRGFIARARREVPEEKE